jgi:hypothetical protein
LQLLEDSVEERMEKALSESDKIEAENKDADAEDNKAWSSCFVVSTSYIVLAMLLFDEMPTFLLL